MGSTMLVFLFILIIDKDSTDINHILYYNKMQLGCLVASSLPVVVARLTKDMPTKPKKGALR